MDPASTSHSGNPAVTSLDPGQHPPRSMVAIQYPGFVLACSGMVRRGATFKMGVGILAHAALNNPVRVRMTNFSASFCRPSSDWKPYMGSRWGGDVGQRTPLCLVNCVVNSYFAMDVPEPHPHHSGLRLDWEKTLASAACSSLVWSSRPTPRCGFGPCILASFPHFMLLRDAQCLGPHSWSPRFTAKLPTGALLTDGALASAKLNIHWQQDALPLDLDDAMGIFPHSYLFCCMVWLERRAALCSHWLITQKFEVLRDLMGIRFRCVLCAKNMFTALHKVPT